MLQLERERVRERKVSLEYKLKRDKERGRDGERWKRCKRKKTGEDYI